MKEMNIIKLLILTGLFIALTTGCQKEIKIGIDNPTNKMIKFKIDTSVYKIYPNHLAHYKISSGEHQLIINNDTAIINLKPSKKYVLNPTRNTYIVASIIYGDAKYEKIYNMNKKAFEKGRS